MEIYNTGRNTEDIVPALNFLSTDSPGKTQSKDYQLPDIPINPLHCVSCKEQHSGATQYSVVGERG